MINYFKKNIFNKEVNKIKNLLLSNNTLIVGQGGSGKTNLIHSLMQECHRQKKSTLLISCDDILLKQKDIINSVDKKFLLFQNVKYPSHSIDLKFVLTNSFIFKNIIIHDNDNRLYLKWLYYIDTIKDLYRFVRDVNKNLYNPLFKKCFKNIGFWAGIEKLIDKNILVQDYSEINKNSIEKFCKIFYIKEYSSYDLLAEIMNGLFQNVENGHIFVEDYTLSQIGSKIIYTYSHIDYMPCFNYNLLFKASIFNKIQRNIRTVMDVLDLSPGNFILYDSNFNIVNNYFKEHSYEFVFKKSVEFKDYLYDSNKRIKMLHSHLNGRLKINDVTSRKKI